MRPLLTFAFICLLITPFLAQQTHFVDQAATGNETGQTWVDAFIYLQDAIAAAQPSDSILVAEGTYRPDEGANQTNDDVTAVFTLVDSMVLKGGYPSGGGSVAIPDSHVTVLSGELNASGVISNRILDIFNIDWSVVTGFKLEGCSDLAVSVHAVDSVFLSNLTFKLSPHQYAKGIDCFNSNALIRHVNFRDNQDIESIYLMNLFWGNYVLEQVVFKNNDVQSLVYSSGKFTMDKCVVAGNICDNPGCLYMQNSHTKIFNSTFYNNESRAIAVYSGENEIYNNTFHNNTIDILASTTNTYIENNIFSDSDYALQLTNVNRLRNNITSRAYGDEFISNQNIIADPLFVDSESEDFRLSRCSPAINSGILNVLQDSVDIANENRYVGSRIDRGAFEFQSIVEGASFMSLEIGTYPTCDKFGSGVIVFSGDTSGIFTTTGLDKHLPLDSILVGIDTFTYSIDTCQIFLIDTIKRDFPSLIFVDSTATGNENGCSWGNAFNSLGKALANSEKGDTIKIAAGTYYPDEGGASTPDDRNAVFRFLDSMVIIGGYAPGGSELSNPALYITRLSGEIQQDSIQNNNSYKLVEAPDVQVLSLRGLVFSDGYATSSAHNHFINLMNTNVQIRKCTIENVSSTRSSILNLSGANFTIDSCLFSNLHSSNNYVVNIKNANGSVLSSKFSENYGKFAGAIYIESSSVDISQSYFLRNRAFRGGALRIRSSSAINVENSIFYDNESAGDAAHMYLIYASGARFASCNFVGADSSLNAVEIYRGSNQTFENCIFWNNTKDFKFEDLHGDPIITNCVVQSNISGSNLVHGNPMFRDPENLNFSLGTCSSAIDVGGLNTVGNEDIRGNTRVFNGIIDIGAVENQDTFPTISNLRVDSIEGLTCDGYGSAIVLWQGEEDVQITINDIDKVLPLDSLTSGTKNLELYIDSCSLSVTFEVPQIESSKHYVDLSNTSGMENGCSWQTAFSTLQQALLQVTLGDTILIAEGMYYPDEGPSQVDNDTNSVFIIPTGVTIIGGFPSGGGLLPNADSFSTILSGEIQQDGDSTNNSRVLMRYVGGRTLKIQNLVFEYSYGTLDDHSAVMTPNNTLHASRCQFRNNVGGNGGAVRAKHINFNKCAFERNRGKRGGALYISGVVSIDHSLFFKNNSVLGGSLYIVNRGEGSIINSKFIENMAENSGGAIRKEAYTETVELRNCLFAYNKANAGGALITRRYSSNYGHTNKFKIQNCTFHENVALNTGDHLYAINDRKTFSVRNSIFSGVSTASFNRFPSTFENNMVIDYTDGVNTINAKPKFVNVEAADFRLIGCSPGINAGSNFHVVDTVDMAGNPRLIDNVVDLGCYEYQDTIPADMAIAYVDQMATGTGNGASWTDAFTSLSEALTCAYAGDSIFVAEGIYIPEGEGRLASFSIGRSESITGGFQTGGADWNPGLYATVLSGDLGVQHDSSDNAYSVVMMDRIGAKINGFTISGGVADSVVGDGTHNQFNTGGGIYVRPGNIENTQIKNCIIKENSGIYGGGVSFNSTYRVNGNLRQCLFFNNTATKGENVLINGSYVWDFFGPTFTLSTLIGTDSVAGSIYTTGEKVRPKFNSTIHWGELIQEYPSGHIASFSLIKSDGALNPNFVDQQNGNFQLGDCSPAINAGNPMLNVDSLDLDLTGNSRVQNGAYVDIGAFENQGGTEYAMIQGFSELHPAFCDSLGLLSVHATGTNLSYNWNTPGDSSQIQADGENEYRVTVSSENCVDTASFFVEMRSNGHIYVDSANVDGEQNGCSWATAFTKLADAIRIASRNDTIYIAKGTYYADEGRGVEEDNGSKSFLIQESVTIIGGFANSGGNDRNWDVDAYPVVLSGAIQQGLNPWNNTITLINIYNSAQDETDTINLYGLYFEDAVGHYSGFASAIYARYNCAVNVRSCHFRNSNSNSFTVNFEGSVAGKLENCTFSNCDVYLGIIGSSSPQPIYVVNCSFAENGAVHTGIVPTFRGSNSNFNFVSRNCIFWDENVSVPNSSSRYNYENCLIRRDYSETEQHVFDPRFIDPEHNDLRLSDCSPAVNQGSIVYVSTDHDAYGNPRISNDSVDLGAYEKQGPLSWFAIDSVAVIHSATCQGGGQAFASQVGNISGTLIWDSGETGNFADSLQAGNNVVTLSDGICSDSVDIYIPIDNLNNVVYVDSAASGLENGCSWINAFSTLNDALRYTKDFDTIKVAQGTYFVENQNGFVVDQELYFYGGYDAITGERNVNENETVFRGRFEGSNTSSERVLFLNNPGNAVIDGVTVMDAWSYTTYGGGIGIQVDSQFVQQMITINNCKLINNHAHRGGGLAMTVSNNADGRLIVQNCEIGNNLSRSEGVNIYLKNNGGVLKSQCIQNVVYNDVSSTVRNSDIYIDGLASPVTWIVSQSTLVQERARHLLVSNGNNNINVQNTIFDGIYQENVDGSVIFRYCNLREVDYPPAYTDKDNHDFRPTHCSPTIDKGRNERVPWNLELDFDGKPRIYNDYRVDIGAFEVDTPLLLDIDSIVTIQPMCTTLGRITTYTYGDSLNYTWSTGSTDSMTFIDVPETYFVTVTRGDCNLIDSVFTYLHTDTVYVDESYVGQESGCSWESPFRQLSDALDLTSASVIMIAEGTYYVDQGRMRTQDDRDEEFTVNRNLQLIGGFPSGGAEVPSVDSFYASISTNMSSGGSPYNLFRIDNDDVNVILRNLNIENANSFSTSYHTIQIDNVDTLFLVDCKFKDIRRSSGSVIYAEAADGVVVVDGCDFQNVDAVFGGAVVFADSLEAVNFTNCSFVDGNAQRGTALYAETQLESTFNGCVFENNRASAGGGIVYCKNSDIQISNSVFGNTQASYGGIIEAVNLSNVFFNECQILDTRAGTGVLIYGSTDSITIDNCEVFGSISTSQGVIYSLRNNYLNIYQSAFDNHPDYQRSFLNRNFGTINVVQSTLSQVGSSNNEMFKLNNFDTLVVANSILDDDYIVNATEKLKFSQVLTTTPIDNDGIVVGDPLFIERDSHDYRLQVCSPAIGQGISSYLIDTLDLQDSARVVDQVDLGAYEFQGRGSFIRIDSILLLDTLSCNQAAEVHVLFENADTAQQISWSNGDTTAIANPATSGWYSVVVSNENCAATDSIFINPYRFKHIYVDSTNTDGPHVGCSWNAAFQYLTDALNIANNGDTIHVAEGSYYPTGARVVGGSHDVNTSFSIQKDITILGGYQAGGMLRDVDVYETFIDGDASDGQTSKVLVQVSTHVKKLNLVGLHFRNVEAVEGHFLHNQSSGASKHNIYLDHCAFSSFNCLNSSMLNIVFNSNTENRLTLRNCIATDSILAQYMIAAQGLRPYDIRIDQCLIDVDHPSMNFAFFGGSYYFGISSVEINNSTILAHDELFSIQYCGLAVDIDVKNSITTGHVDCDYGTYVNSIRAIDTLGDVFVDRTNYDYQIKPGIFEIIDAGKDSIVPTELQFDIAGNPRIQQNAIDIGAFESNYTCQGNTFVDVDATGLNDGSSWTDAFTSLDWSLGLSSHCIGDTVFIAEGVYYPTNSTLGFRMPTNSVVLGGFDADIDFWDPDLYPVYLNGALSDIVSQDDADHVLSVQDFIKNSYLIGVNIVNGEADGVVETQQRGAGLYCKGELTLIQSTISNCRSNQSGDAIYCVGPEGKLILIDVVAPKVSNSTKDLINIQTGAIFEVINSEIGF